MRRWIGVALLGCTVSVLGCTAGGAPPLPGAGSQAASAGAVRTDPPDRPPGQSPANQVPTLKSVAALHLTPGGAIVPEETPQPLYATHPLHRPRIAWLLDRLGESTPMGGATSVPARSPELRIALIQGRGLSIRLAFDCSAPPTEAGLVQTCREAPNQVVLRTGDGQEQRVLNPVIAAWLRAGWREDIPVGAALAMDRETALAIARQVDAAARWQAVHEPEYPVEGQSETEIRDVWLVSAEHKAGHKTVVIIDAITGQVIRVVHTEPMLS